MQVAAVVSSAESTKAAMGGTGGRFEAQTMLNSRLATAGGTIRIRFAGIRTMPQATSHAAPAGLARAKVRTRAHEALRGVVAACASRNDILQLEQLRVSA